MVSMSASNPDPGASIASGFTSLGDLFGISSENAFDDGAVELTHEPQPDSCSSGDNTRASKASRVKMAIREHWRTKSDREIAKITETTATTVGRYRKQLEDQGEILPRIKTGHSIEPWLKEVSILAIRPAPENNLLYDPVKPDSPEFRQLVDDIRENGVLCPPGVSGDGYIYDGHRRFAACKELGLNRITVRIDPSLSHRVDGAAFVRRLKSCNNQRVKTTQEEWHEGLVGLSDDPVPYLADYRCMVSEVEGIEVFQLTGEKRRSEITQKRSLAHAIKSVVMRHYHRYGPLSDRKVFYLLLNIEGLLRNDQRQTPFENSPECYNDVTDLVTRLRLNGQIPFKAICDETRPVIIWDTHLSVGSFIKEENEEYLSGYFRALLQSQPNHIEFVVEKNTMASTLKPVTSKYTIPMTSGRGYSSLPPRKGIVDRFRRSGREKLVLLVVSDFDPEGQDIPNSLGISLRDDFGIASERLVIVKPMLTHVQTQQLDLHEGQIAKEDSSRYQGFVSRYGDRCWELEAVPTETLLEIVEKAITNVLDMDAFQQEVDKQDAERQKLDARREWMVQQSLNFPR